MMDGAINREERVGITIVRCDTESRLQQRIPMYSLATIDALRRYRLLLLRGST